MQRPGVNATPSYIGAEIGEIAFPPKYRRTDVENMLAFGRAALVVLARKRGGIALADVRSRRIGLIIGGSNVQQRELAQIHERTARVRCSCGQTTG